MGVPSRWGRPRVRRNASLRSLQILVILGLHVRPQQMHSSFPQKVQA